MSENSPEIAESQGKKRRQTRDHSDDDTHSFVGGKLEREGSSRRDEKRSSKNASKKKKKSSKKESKRKRHHRHRTDDDTDDDSTSTNDSSDSSYDSSKGRKRKRKKEKKKRKSNRDEKKNSASAGSPPSFGKYGIIKPSDMAMKQRSFEIWMAEIKGVPSFNGSKWELQEYFKEYAEDYNTATLPHKKYYDYDKWEMQEYEKLKQEEQSKMNSSNIMLADEARHYAAMRQLQEQKRLEELKFVRATILNSSTKLNDMKRQKDLQAELQHAFKVGDKERVARIKQKLEIDER